MSSVRKLTGVIPILPTPFADDGGLDSASMGRLIELMVQVGADGVAILGFLGEAHKLAEAERNQVVRTVVDAAQGRLSVCVGVRALGTAGAIEQAQAAASLGADAVLVAPIAPQNDEALYQHFKAVATSVDVPVVLHDYPASFGITMSVPLIARLNAEGYAPYLKQEDVPPLSKLTKVMEGTSGGIGAFGGLGGQYFLEELDRGAAGIMTGFAFPEVLVDIYRRYRAGDVNGAAQAFHEVVDLLRYEFQPGIGLAFRKYVYRARGVFSTEVCRSPASALSEKDRDEYVGIAKRSGLELEKERAGDGNE